MILFVFFCHNKEEIRCNYLKFDLKTHENAIAVLNHHSLDFIHTEQKNTLTEHTNYQPKYISSSSEKKIKRKITSNQMGIKVPM